MQGLLAMRNAEEVAKLRGKTVKQILTAKTAEA
jgi:hypothetical protein